MLGNMYPFWAAITANLLTQGLKPFVVYRNTKVWDSKLFVESGGFPSSHTSTVVALALAVGLQERFSSTVFAVAALFALIVMYDAANVRYYAGQNIQITQQLIRDIQILTEAKLDDPIYMTRVKEVLGHKWMEVIAGVGIGLLIAALTYFLR